MTATVKKVAGKIAVVIPVADARNLGLSDGDSVQITLTADAIVVRQSGMRPRRSMKSLLPKTDRAAYKKHRRLID